MNLVISEVDFNNPAPLSNPRSDDPVLSEHAAEIRRLGKRAKEDICAIGKHLDKARKHAPGAFLKWIEDEFGWSDQTAYRFIHLYEAQQEPDFHILWNSDLPLSGLYALAAPNTPNEARQEIAERIEAGEKPSVAVVQETIAKTKKAAKFASDDSTSSTASTPDAEAEAKSDGDHGDDDRGDDGHEEHRDDAAAERELAQVDRNDIGPNSRGEIERRLARVEELERELRVRDVRIRALEAENENLKAAADLSGVDIAHQRRQFHKALRTLIKAEQPETGEKEQRFLRSSALIDLVELVQSLPRDGLNGERIDLTYRPMMPPIPPAISPHAKVTA